MKEIKKAYFKVVALVTSCPVLLFILIVKPILFKMIFLFVVLVGLFFCLIFTCMVIIQKAKIKDAMDKTNEQ